MDNQSRFRRTFVAFHLVLAVVIFFQSVEAALSASGWFAERPLNPHMVFLGSIEAALAIVFVLPRTVRVGAVGLLAVFVVAIALHLRIGEFPASLVVYAAGVAFVGVHGAAYRHCALTGSATSDSSIHLGGQLAMNGPLHVERTHAFELPLPAHRALGLFTPVGEKAWVPGWEPAFHYPADGALREHAAFTTTSPSEPNPTIWLVTRFDPDLLTVSYARVTPGSRAGEVTVVVSPQSPSSCKVTVSYYFTALSQAGNDCLASFTDEYFEAYISSWRDLIHAHLQSTPESRESHGAV